MVASGKRNQATHEYNVTTVSIGSKILTKCICFPIHQHCVDNNKNNGDDDEGNHCPSPTALQCMLRTSKFVAHQTTANVKDENSNGAKGRQDRQILHYRGVDVCVSHKMHCTALHHHPMIPEKPLRTDEIENALLKHAYTLAPTITAQMNSNQLLQVSRTKKRIRH
jgi:hypothetical protein